MRRKKENTLLRILIWICSFAIVLALVSTGWAAVVYRERNGSFLPKFESSDSAPAPDERITFGAPTPPPDAGSLERDPNATSDAPAPKQTQETDQKDVSMMGFRTLKIAANTTQVDVDFYNPPSNEGEYLMTFELLFPTEGGSYESVYSSGLVAAGEHIRNITLSHPVGQGKIDNCILRIQPYYAASKAPANSAEVVFTLYAE